MSNTPKRADGQFSLAAYKAKVKGEPFPLDIGEDEPLLIQRPSGDQVLDAQEAERRGDMRSAIEAICGDQAETVLELLGPLDASVMKAFVTDLRKYFGLGG